MVEATLTHTIIEKIKEESNRFQILNHEVGKVIVGQHDIVNFIVIAILCNGHILLEGVPGVAKTTMIKLSPNLSVLNLIVYNSRRTYYQQI